MNAFHLTFDAPRAAQTPTTKGIATVSELRRALRAQSIKAVFVRVQLSDDGGTYVQASKSALMRSVSDRSGGELVDAAIRADEPDAIYVG